MITLNKGLLIENMDYEAKKNIIKRSISLFKKIDDELEGYRYYNSIEENENRKNFIYAILYKDISYLENYEIMLENSDLYNEIIKLVNSFEY